MSNREEVVAMLIALSAFYGQAFRDDVIQMYAEDLIDLPIEKLREAFLSVRRDPKINRFPLPAVIRAQILPPETDESNALEAVSKIIEAVAKFGWTNPAQARSHIGELGWRVVQMDGGWENVCKLLSEENLGVFRSQWKAVALNQIRRGKFGMTNPPDLPRVENRTSGGLVQIGAILQSTTPDGAA